MNKSKKISGNEMYCGGRRQGSMYCGKIKCQLTCVDTPIKSQSDQVTHQTSDSDAVVGRLFLAFFFISFFLSALLSMRLFSYKKKLA